MGSARCAHAAPCAFAFWCVCVCKDQDRRVRQPLWLGGWGRRARARDAALRSPCGFGKTRHSHHTHATTTTTAPAPARRRRAQDDGACRPCCVFAPSVGLASSSSSSSLSQPPSFLSLQPTPPVAPHTRHLSTPSRTQSSTTKASFSDWPATKTKTVAKTRPCLLLLRLQTASPASSSPQVRQTTPVSLQTFLTNNQLNPSLPSLQEGSGTTPAFNSSRMKCVAFLGKR